MKRPTGSFESLVCLKLKGAITIDRTMVACFKIMRIEKYLFFIEVEKHLVFYSDPLEQV